MINNLVGDNGVEEEDKQQGSMRTIKTAFNVNCSTMKTPSVIMNEMKRALEIHKVTNKQVR